MDSTKQSKTDIYSQLEKMIEVGETKYSQIKKVVKKGKVSEKKATRIIWVIYAVLTLFLLYYNVHTFLSIYNLQTKYLVSNIYLNIIYFFVMIATFTISTMYDYWNYRNRKRAAAYFILLSICSFVCMLICLMAIRLVVPLVFEIPIGINITVSMVLNLARGIVAVASVVPTIAIFMKLKHLIFEKENVEILYGFKIKKYIDIRKNKEFLYDMKIVKKLEDGKVYNIKQKDRQLHMSISGVTGTAKTSACMTPGITDDMEQRVKNENYVKEKVFKAACNKHLLLCEDIKDEDFNLRYFKALDKKGENLLEDLREIQSAGITVMAPNAAFADTIYEIAKNRNFKKINRIDPTLENGVNKEGFVGFNPLYMSPLLDELGKKLEIYKKAKLFADVLQALYELNGSSDSYFVSLNRNFTTMITILILTTYEDVHPNRFPTPEDVRDCINNFDNIDKYYNALLKRYGGSLNANGLSMGFTQEMAQALKKIDCGEYQFISAQLINDIYSKSRDTMENQIRGLRVIMNEFLGNPLIKNVLCSQNSVDLDKCLADNEITIVNYALELGQADATAFGLFFGLSFNNAVLRRPGTEDTRTPHYFWVDEFPVLLHKNFESMFTLWRQYNVPSCVAFQTYDQFDKTPQTKYLKGVMRANVGHQIVFGRASLTEMKSYSELAGKELEYVEQKSVSETALSIENPTLSYSTRFTPQLSNKMEGYEIRNRDFQEITMFTVDQGNIQEAFAGKVNFLEPSRYKKSVKKTVRYDWSKLYNPELFVVPDETENLVVVTAEDTSKIDAKAKDENVMASINEMLSFSMYGANSKAEPVVEEDIEEEIFIEESSQNDDSWNDEEDDDDTEERDLSFPLED